MTTNEPNVTPALAAASENQQINTDEVPFALRLVVYGLGAAIVVMLGLILYGFTVGFDGDDADTGRTIAKTPTSADTLGAGVPAPLPHGVPHIAASTREGSTLHLQQPEGFELTSSSYANGALVMHFRKVATGGAPSETRILILDLATGAVHTVVLGTHTAP